MDDAEWPWHLTVPLESTCDRLAWCVIRLESTKRLLLGYVDTHLIVGEGVAAS